MSNEDADVGGEAEQPPSLMLGAHWFHLRQVSRIEDQSAIAIRPVVVAVLAAKNCG